MLWRVLGGTDEAGVNLQGLVSLTRHVSSISFFPSEHCSLSRRGLEIFCGCVEKIAAAGRRRSDQVAEPMRMWRNTTQFSFHTLFRGSFDVTRSQLVKYENE